MIHSESAAFTKVPTTTSKLDIYFKFIVTSEPLWNSNLSYIGKNNISLWMFPLLLAVIDNYYICEGIVNNYSNQDNNNANNFMMIFLPPL